MNITVQIDDISLSTMVGDVLAFDEEGEPYKVGEKTVADLVAVMITERVTKDDRWAALADRVYQIRAEEIRNAVRPQITEALTKPIRQHTLYGEAHGPETTLSAMIAAEARAMLMKPADQYNRDGRTIIGKLVAEEVAKAFKGVIADEVKQARALVADQIGEQVAEAVKAGMKAR
jgi:hypothetical protein